MAGSLQTSRKGLAEQLKQTRIFTALSEISQNKDDKKSSARGLKIVLETGRHKSRRVATHKNGIFPFLFLPGPENSKRTVAAEKAGDYTKGAYPPAKINEWHRHKANPPYKEENGVCVQKKKPWNRRYSWFIHFLKILLHGGNRLIERVHNLLCLSLIGCRKEN